MSHTRLRQNSLPQCSDCSQAIGWESVSAVGYGHRAIWYKYYDSIDRDPGVDLPCVALDLSTIARVPEPSTLMLTGLFCGAAVLLSNGFGVTRTRIMAAMCVAGIVFSTSTASAITFGEWAASEGYSPGDVMPDRVRASEASIDSLAGIGDYDWSTTPTINLWLNGNQLTSIDSGVFEGLKNVRGLFLWNNELSSIERGAFNGPTSLEDLILSGNQISSIELGAFDDLSDLWNLTLSGNPLQTIESGLFGDLPDLEHLGLAATQLTAIDANAFDGMPSLRGLSLSENRLAAIDFVPLSGLSSLGFLDLSNNQLTTIRSNAFLRLPSLSDLRLGGNQLTTLETNAFSGLTELVWLGLASNQMSTVETGAFNGSGTRAIHLEHNAGLMELNLARVHLPALLGLGLEGNTNITSVSLDSAVLDQHSIATLFKGGFDPGGEPFAAVELTGINELPGITELDLSRIDFVDITDLSELYPLDDLTDLWLVGTKNLDAAQLDELLDELDVMQATDVEGVLYMTQADYNAFNASGGGLLESWHNEPGHHVVIISEASTLVLGGLFAVCVSFRRGMNHRVWLPASRSLSLCALQPHEAKCCTWAGE